MKFDNKVISLFDACLDVSYGYTESATNDKVGPHFLRITDIQKGIVDWKTVPYCTIDQQKIDKYLLAEGDIVIARTGNSTGENYAYRGTEKAVFASYLIRYRIDTNRFNPFYIWYNLRSKKWFDFVEAVKGGSAQAGASAKLLGSYEIAEIDIESQNKIVDILQNIDDKISKNNQINQTLETIAQTLFKSWFVDFDPVKAKIAAKEQGQDPQLAVMIAISGKTAEQIAQLPADKRNELAATADLFPDEMVESELGMIPRGWKVENLSSVTTQIKRGITPKYIENDGVIVLNQKCIRNHTLNFEFARRHNNKLKSINDSCVEIGDILVNSTGVGTLGRVAIVRRLPEKTIIDTHVTVVRADEDKINKAYLGVNLLGREMEIESLAEGTTGQTELKRSLLEVLPLMIPQKDLQNLFAQILTPQLESYAKNEKENSTLIQIRDALLPRLLSGEIEIKQ